MVNNTKKFAFVCVPGGFCPSGFFDRTVAIFEAQGYPVHAIDLPSVGRREQGPASLEHDAEHIRSQVRIFADQGLDVVLVGNSYGG
jgi:pimeloyl-ACP methyl ester carboxylesterase